MDTRTHLTIYPDYVPVLAILYYAQLISIESSRDCSAQYNCCTLYNERSARSTILGSAVQPAPLYRSDIRYNSQAHAHKLSPTTYTYTYRPALAMALNVVLTSYTGICKLASDLALCKLYTLCLAGCCNVADADRESRMPAISFRPSNSAFKFTGDYQVAFS